MARTFFISKLWHEILTRLGLIETNQGNLPPAIDYNTIADIRAEATHIDEDRIFCLENQITYQFDVASTDADDGFAVLKPNNIASGNPGRWHIEYQLALKNHTHAEKANVIANPNGARFLIASTQGHPVESNYGNNSFAAYDHNHNDDYASSAVLAALSLEIAALSEEVGNKIPRPLIQQGDVGKPAVFDVEGNLIPGGGVVFYQYSTGALVADTLKSCPHNKNLLGYIINARSRDNHNNAQVMVLEPTPLNANNSVDIKVPIDIPEPGLTIQIMGI